MGKKSQNFSIFWHLHKHHDACTNSASSTDQYTWLSMQYLANGFFPISGGFKKLI